MNDLSRQVARARGWRMVVCDGRQSEPTQAYWVDDKTGKRINVDSWHPKTNIAQAMELLEELRAHGWVINIYNPVLNWRVCLMPTYASGSILRAEAEANNLSEAICLAYLKAKGKEAQDVHST